MGIVLVTAMVKVFCAVHILSTLAWVVLRLSGGRGNFVVLEFVMTTLLTAFSTDAKRHWQKVEVAADDSQIPRGGWSWAI